MDKQKPKKPGIIESDEEWELKELLKRKKVKTPKIIKFLQNILINFNSLLFNTYVFMITFSILFAGLVLTFLAHKLSGVAFTTGGILLVLTKTKKLKLWVGLPEGDKTNLMLVVSAALMIIAAVYMVNIGL